jgi:hypothetical protein
MPGPKPPRKPEAIESQGKFAKEKPQSPEGCVPSARSWAGGEIAPSTQ